MDPALSVSSLDAWAFGVLDQLGKLPQVHRAGLAVVEGGGRQLLFTATERIGSGSLDWCHIDAYDDVPLTMAVRQGTIVAGALDGLDPRFSGFARSKRETGSEAIAAVPLTSGASVVGGCILYFDRPQSFDAEQRALLRELGTSLGDRFAHVRATARKRRRRAAAIPPASDRHVVFDVPADPAAVPGARTQARLALLGWGVEAECIDSALLCLSEVVTNALIHTDGGCRVGIRLGHGVLAVRVHDDGGAGRLPSADGEDSLQVRGRGLQIVEALTARSGRDEAASVSWFELDVE